MLANALTLARIPLAATFAILVTSLGRSSHVPLPGVFLLLVIVLVEEMTDICDGMVARMTGTSSVLGGILDPAADSLSRLTMYFSLALVGWISIAVPFVMVARDILVAYTRIVQALTGGRTSARVSGKFKALVQGVGIAVIVALAVGGRWLDAGPIRVLQGVTATMIILVTCWSLFDYVHGAMPGIRALYRR